MPPALILALDAALDGCLAAVVAIGEGPDPTATDGRVVAERRQAGGRGSAATLPAMADQVLAEAGVAAPELALIAVTVGPGSFTGVRAALALAAGLGLGAGVRVAGVSLGDAIRAEAACAVPVGTRAVWVAIDSRRGRVFLDRGDGALASVALSALPDPDGPVAMAGDAAEAAAAQLVGRGHDVQLLPLRTVGALGLVRAALHAARPAVPLYVDGVEARPGPAARPAPA